MTNNIKDLLVRIESTKQEFDPEELEASRLEAKKELIELNGKRQFFILRNQWSICIIIWISIFILFHISITYFLGFGLISFAENQWFLPSLLLENFLQIIGMGYIVVNFLYPKQKDK